MFHIEGREWYKYFTLRIESNVACAFLLLLEKSWRKRLRNMHYVYGSSWTQFFQSLVNMFVIERTANHPTAFIHITLLTYLYIHQTCYTRLYKNIQEIRRPSHMLK